MRLQAAAKAMHAKLVGVDANFDAVSTDSRKVAAGQLFFALKGEHFDGHDYAQTALDRGVAAVVVNAESAESKTLSPALVVSDTYQALGQLAHAWRADYKKPVIAITGSNGKTTVKEMLACILVAHTEDRKAVLATQGNLNNHIGLPLTLLAVKPEHDYAIVEMGMNHSGEIRYLSNIAKPDMVLINNAGNAHLGELGSLEAIAKAKGEIIEGLVETGTVILNGDDDFYPLWKKLAQGKKIITFGLNANNTVHGLITENGLLAIKTSNGETKVKLASRGLHNAKNAAAAAAASIELGVPLNVIKRGLENFVGVSGRLQTKPAVKGATVIDDTYNANPVSMRAAIDVLKEYKGKTILVVGDMGELGPDAVQMHADIGEYAQDNGIRIVYSLGQTSHAVTKAFGEAGRHFDSVEQLNAALKENLDSETTVLVKGSRFMKMERTVQAIQQEQKNKELG